MIDPTDTDVSIRYDISFDLSELSDTKIKIDSIEEVNNTNNLIKTGENTYSGIIRLEEIQNKQTNKIVVNFTWDEDETTNEGDTAMGIIPDNKISIPVKVKVTQYLGEEITEVP